MSSYDLKTNWTKIGISKYGKAKAENVWSICKYLGWGWWVWSISRKVCIELAVVKYFGENLRYVNHNFASFLWFGCFV